MTNSNQQTGCPDDRDVQAVVRKMSSYGRDFHTEPRKRRAKRDAIGAILSKQGRRVILAMTVALACLSLLYWVYFPFLIARVNDPMLIVWLIPAFFVPVLPWGLLLLAKLIRHDDD